MKLAAAAAVSATLLLTACTQSGELHTQPAPSQRQVAPIAQRVLDWWQTSVADDLGAVQRDQVALGRAGGRGDFAGVHAACAQLKIDVGAVETDPPSPDDAMRQLLSQAMDAYSTGASECLDGSLMTASRSMREGTRWIYRTVARVKALQ